MALFCSESFAGCSPKNKAITILKNAAENDKICYLSASNIIVANFTGVIDVIFMENTLVCISSKNGVLASGDSKGYGHVLESGTMFKVECGDKIQDCCFLDSEIAIFSTFDSIVLFRYKKNIKFTHKMSYLISSVETIDNKIVVGGLSGSLEILSVIQDGESGHSFILNSIAIIDAHLDSISDIKSYKNRYIATCSQDHNIKIWNYEPSSSEIVLFQTLNGHTDWVNFLFWSGNFLYSASSDKTIRVWEISDQKDGGQCGFYACTDIIGGVAEFMNVLVYQNRLLGHLKTGGIDKLQKNEYFLSGHLGEIMDLDWKNNMLVTCSLDKTSRVFFDKKERARPQKHGFSLTSIKFLPSEKLRFVSSGQETILRMYEATQKFFIICQDKNLEKIIFKNHSMDDYAYSAFLSELNLTNEIASQSNDEPLSENSLATDAFKEIKKAYGHFFEIKNIAVGKDIILSCNRSALNKYGGLFVWSMDGTKIQYVPCHDLGIQKIAISPNNKLAMTVSRDKSSCLYSIENSNLEIIKRFFDHNRIVWDCGFSRDSRLAATCSRDGSVILYDLRTFEICKTKSFSTEITSLCFSPSESYLAIGTNSGTLKILDYQLEVVEEMKAVGKSINVLRFDDTGKKIAVGGSDGLLRILSFASENN